MTNSEAINSMRNLDDVISITESEHESVKLAIKALEENDNLKADIERLSNVNGCLVRINYKQNEEIEQLKE